MNDPLETRLKVAHHVIGFNGVHPYTGEWTRREKKLFLRMLLKWKAIYVTNRADYKLDFTAREEKNFVDFMTWVLK